MKKKYLPLIAVIFTGIMGFMGFKIYKSFTLPPGCKSTPVMGGCFSKNKTTNLRLSSVPECLQINSNDCSQASLELYNKCESEVTLQKDVLSNGYNYRVFTMNAQGKAVLLSPALISQYPKESEKISLSGTYEGKEFSISYIRTKALCD